VNTSKCNHLWFAIQVRYRHEFSTARLLHERGYKQLVPSYIAKRRWSDRWKEIECPLFSGYIFCQFNSEAIFPIVSTPGVIRIVGCQNQPIPLSNKEIEAIQRVVQSPCAPEPCNYLQSGTRVRIIRGPLTGLEGIVNSYKGRYRLILSVELVQRSIAMEIAQDWIDPAEGYSCRADLASINPASLPRHRQSVSAINHSHIQVNG